MFLLWFGCETAPWAPTLKHFPSSWRCLGRVWNFEVMRHWLSEERHQVGTLKVITWPHFWPKLSASCLIWMAATSPHCQGPNWASHYAFLAMVECCISRTINGNKSLLYRSPFQSSSLVDETSNWHRKMEGISMYVSNQDRAGRFRTLLSLGS